MWGGVIEQESTFASSLVGSIWAFSVRRSEPRVQVLGHQLITEGLCDILISWTYPNSSLKRNSWVKPGRRDQTLVHFELPPKRPKNRSSELDLGCATEQP